MAEIFIEGFEKYGPVGLTTSALQLSMQQEWATIFAGGCSIVAGLSGTGRAFQGTSGQVYATRTLPASKTVLFFGVRFVSQLAGSQGWQFSNSGVAACSIAIQGGTGLIAVTNGAVSGAALGTSVVAVTAGSVHYLEAALTFGAGATSSYTIYLDGVQILTGATKTFGSSACNQLSIAGANGGSSIISDDMYLFDNTGALCNNVLLTNPQVNTDLPNSDSAVQFAFGANVLGLPYSIDGSTVSSPGANELVLRKFTPAANCTINSVSLLPGTTSAGANFKPCIYSDSGGAAHTLLSTGSQVTGTTNGTVLNLPLTTPQALVAGTQYWIGYITDTSINVFETDFTLAAFKAANTYTSGAPATAPAMTSGQPSFTIWGNVSGVATNFPQVDEPGPSYGALSFNQSSTVGQQDLLGFPALGGTTGNIYTVKISASLANSDAGARTANVIGKSGGTTSNGSAGPFSPTASFLYYDSYFSTDPNTGVAWGPSGLNAATFGYKVAA